ncbi:MAG: hypothetical protein WBA57_27265 [Elainellaceae cyanobacterium]
MGIISNLWAIALSHRFMLHGSNVLLTPASERDSGDSRWPIR